MISFADDFLSRGRFPSAQRENAVRFRVDNKTPGGRGKDTHIQINTNTHTHTHTQTHTRNETGTCPLVSWIAWQMLEDQKHTPKWVLDRKRGVFVPAND